MLRFNVDDLSSLRVGTGPCVTPFIACVLASLWPSMQIALLRQLNAF